MLPYILLYTVLAFILLFAVLAGMFGASIASFLGVVSERRKRGESIMGRSRCMCGRELLARENVPVFGWLATLGRAKCCGNKIPVRYFISELASFVWFGLTVYLILWLTPAAIITSIALVSCGLVSLIT